VLDPAFEPLANLADIIKVDFRRVSATDQVRTLQLRRDQGIQFLAEKVETEEEFDRARELGYCLFQGFFFARPVILKTNTMLASRLGYIRLMQAVSSPNPDFRAIVAAIESDVKLSMETIKLSNSAYYGRRQKISSIRQAVVVLGLDGIRKWIYLTSLRRLGTGKPDVLVSTSIIRAKFMEMLAEAIGQPVRSPEYSLLGLFSLLDVLTNCPFEALLSSLNINDEIVGALTGENRESQMSRTLHLIQRYEQGLWQETALLAEAMGITLQQVAEAYLYSLKCYHEFVSISDTD